MATWLLCFALALSSWLAAVAVLRGLALLLWRPSLPVGRGLRGRGTSEPERTGRVYGVRSVYAMRREVTWYERN